MIDGDILVNAVVIVTILLIITSVPSILVTVSGSSGLLKHYKDLRAIKDVKTQSIPQSIRNEWAVVNSPMGYSTLILEEIDRLSNLRPAMFQASIAAFLIVFLYFIPGYEGNVLWIMLALLVVDIVSIVYGRINIAMYTEEYFGMLEEMSTKSDESQYNMYG